MWGLCWKDESKKLDLHCPLIHDASTWSAWSKQAVYALAMTKTEASLGEVFENSLVDKAVELLTFDSPDKS
jgi:hypothetical protein